MSAATLAGLCDRVRPELACLGDAGVPLMAVLGVVERAGTGRPADVLADPGFALDVLSTAGPGADAALVGRVLDFLRTRDGATVTGNGGVLMIRQPQVTVHEAVASYEAGPLAMMAKGSARTYRTWTRRLVDAHPDVEPRLLTTGDLRDLIARHVLARRSDSDRRRAGTDGEEHAVAAYRAMWGYFLQKSWVDENVAMGLRKPTRPDPHRREIRPDEAVLLRHLAISTSRDPLLDEVTLTIPERLALRQIELIRLELCDVDLDEDLVYVWGKHNKKRILPITTGLHVVLERYIEDRRPAHMRMEDWLASHERLLRRPPTGKFPLGRPAGRRHIEGLYERLHRLAPDVFGRGDVVMHSNRHAVGTFVDDHFGRTVARAILGHSSRSDATDAYLHVSIEKKATALQAYEDYVLAADLPAGRVADVVEAGT